jgi:hypothetical protein
MARLGSEQLATNNKLHYFAGASVNALYARVSVGPRNRIFGHITITSMHLQALVYDFALKLSRQKLRL